MGFELRIPPRAEAILLWEGMRVGGDIFGSVIDRASIASALASYSGTVPWVERLETRELGGRLFLVAILKPGDYPVAAPCVRLEFTAGAVSGLDIVPHPLETMPFVTA